MSSGSALQSGQWRPARRAFAADRLWGSAWMYRGAFNTPMVTRSACRVTAVHLPRQSSQNACLHRRHKAVVQALLNPKACAHTRPVEPAGGVAAWGRCIRVLAPAGWPSGQVRAGTALGRLDRLLYDFKATGPRRAIGTKCVGIMLYEVGSHLVNPCFSGTGKLKGV